MTWNVRYFGHPTRGLRATEPAIRRLAWVVAGQAELPDVIALQEVESESLRGGHGGGQLDRFAARLGDALEAHRRPARYLAHYFPAHRYGLGRAALYTTGLAVLVREGLAVEAMSPREITHVRIPGFGRLKQRRLAVHLRIRPSGWSSALDLFNTHLSLPAFLEVGPHRVAARMGHGTNQLAEAAALLSFVGEHAGPHAVVVGDFNSLPGSPVYDHLLASGFVDAHAEVSGRTPTSLRDVGTASFMHLRMHLDHVFSSPAVRWRGLDAADLDHGPFAGLSDHAPKLGRFSLA
jgi:endonuclease/exonuclease/phosphatase family metal-dependent hydrolase